MPRDRKAEIAKRAYELWEAGGRVHGHDLAHWFQAESEFSRTSKTCASGISGRSLNIVEFRQLVDVGGPGTERAEPNLRTMLQQASEENSQRIRENCPKNFSYLFHEMQNIKKGVITDFVLKGLPMQPYYAIAAAIQECLRQSEKATEKHLEAPDWPEIIRLGKERFELHPNVYRHAEDLLRKLEGRSFALADAARKLRDEGYFCDVKDCAPLFADSERIRLVRAIEKKIGALGALGVIGNLCNILHQNYSTQMERYLMPSELNLMGKTTSPSLPINFLLQLALKQVQVSDKAPANAQEQWEDLKALARDFAAIYDVEPYSLWELEFIDAHTLIPYLTDLALHDRMFGVRQYRATDVGKVLRGLFDWVPPKTELAIGWSIAEASNVAETVLTRANISGVTVLSRSNLISACAGIDASIANNILTIFTHEHNPNSGSDLPEIPGKLNFFAKPLIRLNGEQLVMVDRAICAPAFYEAIAFVLRPYDGQTQNNIGLAAERFLIAEMRRRGVSVSCGTYKSSEGDGECDAVIETNDTIIFLELKGKPLTNAAQAGSDVMILLDLFKSLFNATCQANQHDIVLRKNGHIRLHQNDGTEYQLQLKGRQIEKVAVTLLDFGRFQDRTVLTQILGTLLTATVTPRDTKWSAEFVKLNNKTAALRAQIDELAKLLEGFRRQPFFNCWFLSIPQLLVLLDRVNSNDSFKTELWRTRHLTTHSLDWYFEMDYAFKLNRGS